MVDDRYGKYDTRGDGMKLRRIFNKVHG